MPQIMFFCSLDFTPIGMYLLTALSLSMNLFHYYVALKLILMLQVVTWAPFGTHLTMLETLIAYTEYHSKMEQL